MRKIFIVLFVLLISFSFFTFHDKGNSFLKPYFATYLESKLVADMQVDVRHLKIDLNHVEFKAVLNNLVHIDAQGELSLFSQTLDLDYVLQSNELKNKIDINGMIKGTFSNLDIQGGGAIVQSKVNYTLHLKDDLFNHIKVQINKADVASLLALIGEEPYAIGKIDLNVNLKKMKQQAINAKPQILLYGITLNEKVFKQKFGIDLPSDTVLTAKLNAKFAAKIFQVNGVVKSDLATLHLSKTYYNRKTKELSSDYKLLIPRLSKFVGKQKLRGKLEVVGAFQRKNAEVCLSGKSEDLGGRMVFDLKGNRLDAHMNGVDIEKLLLLFGKKPYVRGKIIADIELDDFKKREGIFTFKTKDVKTIHSALSKALNLDFGEDVYFSLNAKGDISSKLINMEAKLDSDIFEYSSSDIKYDFSKKVLNSTYSMYIPRLSKLDSLTGKTLKGELRIKGELNYKNDMLMTGNSKNLGGNIDFKLKSKKLSAKIKNISLEKLMSVLDYPQVFKAKLVGDFNYDLATSSGRFNSKLNEAELLSTYLIQVIKNIRGVDLRDKRYVQTYFNATFQKNLVDINFKAQGKRVRLSIPSGQINKLSNQINAYYKVKVDNKDLEGSITGDIANPEITLDSSKYIQNNIMSVIEESLNPSKVGGFGMGHKEGNVMKNMMDGFFR